MKINDAIAELNDFAKFMLYELYPYELKMTNAEAVILAQAVKALMDAYGEQCALNERLNDENKALIREADK